jgi:thiamine kinase-like enzyme
MVPEGESPLLLPANKHKQLVVIDFEYANANLPGLEFANHFVGSLLTHFLIPLYISLIHLILVRY